MQPGFDLRIRGMIKALNEAILPAIDSANKSAIEQLNIVIGSLALLKDQVEYVHWFEQVETHEMLALARDLGAMLGSSADLLVAKAEQASAAALRADATLSSRQEGNICLRDALTELMKLGMGNEDRDLAERVGREALKRSESQIGRERAFIAGTNLDVFHDNLQSIEGALRSSALAF